MRETGRAWLVVVLALPGAMHGFLARAGESLLYGPNLMVSWEVRLAPGRQATLMASVGEMAQVTRPDGSTIGMVPRLLGADPTVVTFEIFEVIGDPHYEKQGFRKLDDVKAKAGIVTRSSKVKDLAITLTAVTTGPEKTASGSGSASKGVEPLKPPTLLAWRLFIPGAGGVALVSPAGELSHFSHNGRDFAILFEEPDASHATVMCRLFKVSRIEGGGETLVRAESFSVQPGEEYFPREIESILSVVRIDSLARHSSTARLSIWPDQRTKAACCVTCGSFRASSCNASTDCVDCCTTPCCFWAPY